MSYNGSGTFQINTSGQPVVAGTVISSTAFNALTADLATGLSTAITKDGQTTTTARIPFAAGINSSLTTDSTSTGTGSIFTAGGVGIAKTAYIGTNLSFSGTGNRITGDFSNATIANRVAFQTSTVNGNTTLNVLPNGTSIISGFSAFDNSDPTNAAVAQLLVVSSTTSVRSAITGTGTYLPMTFFTNGSEQARIPTTGGFTISQAAGLGYGTGAGGTVTQATSKSTAVTLNKPTGQITMNNAALAAAIAVEFSVNNSLLSINDCINLSGVWGVSPNYRIELKGVFAGGFGVRVTNITAGSLSEALVLNFALIKGATS